jgi:hypothetical protein
MGLITLLCHTPSQATSMSDSDSETGSFDLWLKLQKTQLPIPSIAAAAGVSDAGLGPIQWTTPSSHPSYYSHELKIVDSESDEDDETGHKTQLPIPKRQRNLYGYNFSPPSTPNGNHTIAEREETRKAARIAIAAENDDCADFTPRCLMKQCIADQQALVQDGVNVTDADWNLMVSFLSPAKPPLHPCTKSNINSRPCRFEFPSKSNVTCLCISCAGLKAKPICTPCLVCGALIPYSVCKLKSAGDKPLSHCASLTHV